MTGNTDLIGGGGGGGGEGPESDRLYPTENTVIVIDTTLVIQLLLLRYFNKAVKFAYLDLLCLSN